MKNFLTIFIVGILVYLLSWFVVYKAGINTLAIQSEDTLPAIFTPVTLIKEKTFYLDSFYPMILKKYPHPDDKKYIKGLTPFYVKKIGTHYISAFTLIPPLLAVPVYFIPISLGIPVTWDNLIILSKISSAIIVSLSGALLYLLLAKFFTTPKRSLILTILYMFGTVNYAMVSQALWQHGPLQLFSILSLYFLLLASKVQRKRVLYIFLGGLFMCLGVLSRFTGAFFIPFIFMAYIGNSYGLIDFRSLVTKFKNISMDVVAYILGFIPPALVFIWYNNTFFKDISNQGYASQALTQWLTPFPIGFFGIWISPSKGILVYTPAFIFIFASLAYVLRRKFVTNASTSIKNFIFLNFFALAISFTLIMGRWKHWYGGWSFGYRLASDILPFLMLLLIPYINSMFFQKTKKIFLVFVLASILMNLSGIAFFDGVWHGTYDKGFINTSWLWSIKDSETVFNISRILGKINPQ